MRMLRPAAQPSSCSRCSNAATRGAASGSFSAIAIRTPIRCIRSAGCARTASGHATAAPPSSVMQSRRLRSSMGSPPEPAGTAYRILRLPWKQRQVLGLELNCSESRPLMRLAEDQGATLRPSGCRLTAARGWRGQPLPSRGPLGCPAPLLERANMSTEVPEKLREDEAQATPEWHRARAKGLRKSGFTKMAEEHEQIAQTIERARQQQTK